MSRLILNLRWISYRSATLSQSITLPSQCLCVTRLFIWSLQFQKTLHLSSLPLHYHFNGLTASSSSPPNDRNRWKCYIYHFLSPLSTIYLWYPRRLHHRWQAAPLLSSQSPLVTGEQIPFLFSTLINLSLSHVFGYFNQQVPLGR
jgi:hypothetical protein